MIDYRRRLPTELSTRLILMEETGLNVVTRNRTTVMDKQERSIETETARICARVANGGRLTDIHAGSSAC